jgi:hypothetical protein
MRLLRVRFTIRQAMVVVVIIALALAAMVWLINEIHAINQGLYEFYRPGGRLDRGDFGPGPAQSLGERSRSGATSRPSTRPRALPAADK